MRAARLHLASRRASSGGVCSPRDIRMLFRRGSREIENIWGTRGCIIREKSIARERGARGGGRRRRSGPLNVISSRPTSERIRGGGSASRDLVRATFTLQQRYRISRRRCNRRCNLYLVSRPSAYGLSYVRVTYVSVRARAINLSLLDQVFIRSGGGAEQKSCNCIARLLR